jgi:hypothetical protein
VQPVVTEPHYFLKTVDRDVVYPQSYYRLPHPRRDIQRVSPAMYELLYGAG